MEQSRCVFTNNINDIVHDPEIELVVSDALALQRLMNM